MSELPQPDDQTIDLGTASSTDVARGRFVAAWTEALLGHAAPPELDLFLVNLSEAERGRLRPELETLQEGYRQRWATHDPEAAGDPGETIGPPPATDPGTIDLGPQLQQAPQPDDSQTIDVRSPVNGRGSPGAAVDVPADRSGPAPDGTVDFQAGRAAPDGTVDFQGGQPAAPTDGTLDYRPGSTEEVAQSRPDGTVDHGPSAAGLTGEANRTQGPRGRGPAPVQTVAGYEILGTLGRGAMGVVYKARQRGLKRVVALKMILSGGHADEHERTRFRIEAESVAQIQHPCIVQIYEVGEEDGRPFFSLEYVDGGSLQKKIHGEPLPPREAAGLARQLADGMECAHRHGVIHRDLKPANVLLTREGLPKITDFGLAKRLEEDTGQTHSGTILGTPSYMAPEQAEGNIHQVGPLSDVYSLGAILYELLTGRAPFKAASIIETLQQVRTREPVAPTHLQPGTPRDLETICLKALQKDPQKRYGSAGEMAEDLRRFLAGEPIKARPVPWYERAWRWARRNPKIAGLSAGIAALVVVWAVTASVLKVEADENARIAEANAEVAKTQRQRAEQNEVTAKRNEERARKNEERALANAKASIGRVIGLGEFLQTRLRRPDLARHETPEVRALRDDLLRRLQGEMMGMAAEIEKTGVSSFTLAATAQQLGDLLKRLGRSQEAIGQFQSAYNVAKAVAAREPGNDKAQANLAVMVVRLGDMALEINGDVAFARACYDRSLKLHEQLRDHPRSRTYPPGEINAFLSHDYCRMGQIELEMGHPAAAAGWFQKCLASRKRWYEAETGNATAFSYLSEAYLRVGTAAWRLADAKGVEDAFAEAYRISELLAQQNASHDFSFQADLADILGAWGDARLRLGKTREARATYKRSLDTLEAALAKGADDYAARQMLLAQAHERLAAAARHFGQQGEAAEHSVKALKLREEFAQLEPDNLTVRGAYLLAQAHAGKHAEAAQGADVLRQRAPKSTPVLLQAARCYAACTAAVAPEQGRAPVDKALAALRALVAGGYEDTVALRTDPDLRGLATEPAFGQLLAGLPNR